MPGYGLTIRDEKYKTPVFILVDMMQRRKFVMAVGVAGAAGLAGCLSGDSDPDDVVEEFYAAMDEGDVETMNDLMHEDSEEEITEEDLEEIEDFDITVEETEILEEDDDAAEVRAEITVEGEFLGEEVEETNEETIELRTEDGEWKLYDDEE